MPRKALSSGLNLHDLCAVVQRDRMATRFRREKRVEMVREYVGDNWSEEGSLREVPMNLMALYVQIVSRNLVAQDPRVMYATFNRQGKPAVAAMETWANREIPKMSVANTLQRIIIDAMFSVGIGKIALANPAEASASNWRAKGGQPYFDSIDIDDFCYDVHARRFEDAGYMGHRMRVPLDSVRDSLAFNASRKDLIESDDRPFNEQGDLRISMLGRTWYAQNSQEYEPYVDIWEIYIPRRKLILVFADDGMLGPSDKIKPLLEQQWVGPDEGPYHFLRLGHVPGNAWPKAPIQDLYPLHKAVNNGMRKLLRQSRNMKQVTAFQRGNDGDAKNYKDCPDGGMFAADSPEKMLQLKGHGPNNELNSFTIQLKDAFSWMAGNLETIGGLSPQASTLGQEKILNTNAGGTVASYQSTVTQFTADCMRALGWYWWHNPTKVMKADYSVQGLPNISTVRRVTPQDRQQVLWEELDLDVDPYSMGPDSPASRAQALQEIVTATVLPAIGVMQQQGIGIDWNQFFTKIGHYKNMPDLPEILTYQEPPQETEASRGGTDSQDGVAGPAQTSREYVRKNVPQRTTQGDSINRRNALAGIDIGGSPNGKPQPAGVA